MNDIHDSILPQNFQSSLFPLEKNNYESRKMTNAADSEREVQGMTFKSLLLEIKFLFIMSCLSTFKIIFYFPLRKLEQP